MGLFTRGGGLTASKKPGVTRSGIEESGGFLCE